MRVQLPWVCSSLKILSLPEQYRTTADEIYFRTENEIYLQSIASPHGGSLFLIL